MASGNFSAQLAAIAPFPDLVKNLNVSNLEGEFVTLDYNLSNPESAEKFISDMTYVSTNNVGSLVSSTDFGILTDSLKVHSELSSVPLHLKDRLVNLILYHATHPDHRFLLLNTKIMCLLVNDDNEYKRKRSADIASLIKGIDNALHFRGPQNFIVISTLDDFPFAIVENTTISPQKYGVKIGNFSGIGASASFLGQERDVAGYQKEILQLTSLAYLDEMVEMTLESSEKILEKNEEEEALEEDSEQEDLRDNSGSLSGSDEEETEKNIDRKLSEATGARPKTRTGTGIEGKENMSIQPVLSNKRTEKRRKQQVAADERLALKLQEEEIKRQEDEAREQEKLMVLQQELKGDIGKVVMRALDETKEKLRKAMEAYRTGIKDTKNPKLDLGWVMPDLLEETLKEIEKASNYSGEGYGPGNTLTLADGTSMYRELPELAEGLLLSQHKMNVSSLDNEDRKVYFALILHIFEHNQNVLHKKKMGDDLSRGISLYLALGLCPEEWRSKIVTADISKLLRMGKNDYNRIGLKLIKSADVTKDKAMDGLFVNRMAIIVSVAAFAKCGRDSKITQRAMETLYNGMTKSSEHIDDSAINSWMNTSKTNYFDVKNNKNILIETSYALANRFLNSGNHLPSALVFMSSLASIGGFSKALALRLDGLKAPYKISISHLSDCSNVVHMIKEYRKELEVCFKVATNMAINPFAYNRCWETGRKNDSTLDTEKIASLFVHILYIKVSQGEDTVRSLKSSSKLALKGKSGKTSAMSYIRVQAINREIAAYESIADSQLVAETVGALQLRPHVIDQLQRISYIPTELNPTGMVPEIVQEAGSLLSEINIVMNEQKTNINIKAAATGIVSRIKETAELGKALQEVFRSDQMKRVTNQISGSVSGIFSDSTVSVAKPQVPANADQPSEVDLFNI